MTDQLQVARAGGTRGVGKAQDAEAAKPGALTGYEDGEWTFSGNGKLSATDVMSRIIELEAGNDAALQPFAGKREAAMFAARQNLIKNNAALPQDTEAAIEQGKQFVADGGKSLKALLTPFADKLEQLRELAMQPNAGQLGMDGAAAKATGKVFTPALGLPIDPRL